MSDAGLALYRKYRPRTFGEVVGQSHVTDVLAAALRSGRLHHAYLFSGPRGCGKTSSARILAASLNCADGPTPDPCGTCDNCVAIRRGNSLDVVEIDAASHGSVDDTRDLRERAVFSPASARFKVYIVDEAHMVSTAGFNALLKVVEEPPPFLKFIFATTEPDKVIGTIRSRTHHYPFRLVPASVLGPHLTWVCEQEGVSCEPRALSLVVRAGGGSVRDSMSVLDQLLASADGTGVTYAHAAALLGVTDAALLDEMVDALAARDGATAFAVVARVAEGGQDARRFATDVLDRVRDLLVVQRAGDTADADLLGIAPDEVARLATAAARIAPAELTRMADQVYAGLTEMRGAHNPRLVLEIVCARILLPGAASDELALLTRLERVERRLDMAAEPAPAPAAPTAPAENPRVGPENVLDPRSKPGNAGYPEEVSPLLAAGHTASTVPASDGALDAAAVRRAWDDVLAAVGRSRKTSRALLMNAQVTDLTDQRLTVSFRTSPLAQQFEMGVNADVLAAALHDVLGGTWKVHVTFDRTGSATPVVPAVESFAPGDAAGDDDAAVQPSGEDPAVALLRAGLGAEVIEQRSS